MGGDLKAAPARVGRPPAPTFPRLYLALQGGEILEFDLQSGRMRRGEISTFPDLQQVVERSFPNEEAEVWPTSLRFSSITDGIGAR